MGSVSLEKRTWVCAEIGLTLRRCSRGCGPFKLLAEFGTSPRGVCRDCRNAYKKRLREEGRLADDKAYQARWRREWNAANPERRRAAWERWYAKVMADPDAHAKRRELARMDYRLKREREGVPLDQQRRIRAPVTLRPERLRLPSRPLAEFVDGLAAREAKLNSLPGETWVPAVGEICSRLGVSDRLLRRWRTGTEAVSVEVAERVVFRAHADWEQIWPKDDFPSLYRDGKFALG